MSRHELTPYKIRDLIFRHPGRESAIKSGEIVELLTGKRSTESLEVLVRRAVVTLRKEGYPIASRISGYYWATSPEEMALCQKWLRRKAMHTLALNSKIKSRAMPALVGQMDFGIEAGGFDSAQPPISILVDIQPDQYARIQAFLSERGEWDLDRLCAASIELFLINQGSAK